MSNYIEVSNDRDVVINDTYKNVSLIRKVDAVDCERVYDMHADHGLTKHYFEIPASIGDVVVFHANTMVAPYTPYSFTGGNGLFCNSKVNQWFYDNQSWIFSRGDAFFYIFRWQTTGKENGLEIFNSNGEQIFNSNLKYLRIIDVIKEDVNSANWGTRSYPHKVGVVCCSMPVRYEDFGDRTGGKETLGVYFLNDNSFKIGTTFGYNAGICDSKPGGDWRGEIYILVVDLDGCD